MATLSLHVSLERPDFSVSVREEIALEGITALFGPSGSGKTTLLRIVAGLERNVRGRIVFNDLVWRENGLHVPAHRRRVGYVFQDGRLFPHLTVEGNLRFAVRRARGRALIAFADVVEVLDLHSLLDRRPASLSGGEQQRVAIGRALLASPQLLLMDEPLSSLDSARKREIMPYIERLPAAFGLPVLYVTHDIDEAARLASNMLLQAQGRIIARGPVADILERIDLWPFTGREEAGALLDARVESRHAGMTSLRLGRETLRVPELDAAPGTPLRIRIHARDVAVATQRPENLSIRNILPARVLRIDLDSGAHAELLLTIDGQRVRSRITREALDELGLRESQNVYALIKSVALERLL